MHSWTQKDLHRYLLHIISLSAQDRNQVDVQPSGIQETFKACLYSSPLECQQHLGFLQVKYADSNKFQSVDMYIIIQCRCTELIYFPGCFGTQIKMDTDGYLRHNHNQYKSLWVHIELILFTSSPICFLVDRRRFFLENRMAILLFVKKE